MAIAVGITGVAVAISSTGVGVAAATEIVDVVSAPASVTTAGKVAVGDEITVSGVVEALQAASGI
jgi:hypothetical protein